MIAVQQKQLPSALRSYIGHIKVPLILELKGKPYISIEPETSVSEGLMAFSEIDKIVSKKPAQDFDYKTELKAALENKYESLS